MSLKYNFPIHESIYERNPEQAFQMLIRRLNGKNLKELLLFSSFISVFDFFDTIDYSYNVFTPLINVEQINLLSQAIIRSKSRMYKDGLVEKQDLEYFYHRWLNVISFRTKAIEKQSTSEEVISQQFLAMLNVQQRFLNYRVNQRNTRSYILFCDIPERYRQELKNNLKTSYISIKSEFEKWYGLSADLFFFFGLFLIILYRNYFREIYPKDYSAKKRYEISLIDPEPMKSGNRFLSDKIEGLFHVYSVCKPSLENIILRPDFFVNTPLKDEFERYIKMMAADLLKLQITIEEDAKYREGIILDRLNPLERYPLIEFADNQYAVPNIRYLSQSITDSFHYMLQDNFPDNRYNMTLGMIQEIYIKEIIEASFMPSTLVGELKYKKGKDELKGPDLLLLSDQICVIESKCKRPSAKLRSDPGSKEFITEMRNIQDAFTKAVNKIDDIFSEIDVFSNFHSEINVARRKQPIVIVIMGEGFEFPMETLIHHVSYSNFANLKTYPYKYALINLSLLEEFVSISHKVKVPLQAIFNTISISPHAVINDYPGTRSIIEKQFGVTRKVRFPYFDKKTKQMYTDLSKLAKQLHS